MDPAGPIRDVSSLSGGSVPRAGSRHGSWPDPPRAPDGAAALALLGAGADVSAGNRVAVRLMRVPLDEADPRRRLVEVARATRAEKQLPPVQPSGRLLQRWMVHAMSHQRLVNLLLSNVPGPARPLWFADGMADGLDVLVQPAEPASRHMVKTSGPPSGSVNDPRTTNP